MVLEGRVGPAPNWQAGARGWAVRPATSQQVVLQITLSRRPFCFSQTSFGC